MNSFALLLEFRMTLRSCLVAGLIAFGVLALPAAPARADQILYDSVGVISGAQSSVQSFDITSAGALTVTLTSIPWLDTISDLNCFVSTATSVLGSSFGPGTETLNVKPGMLYAHWFGDANGAYGLGVYGLKVSFQPNASAVPLPAAFILLLSGLGLLMGWQRRPKLANVSQSSDDALAI
jgi:hypothetical protein